LAELDENPVFRLILWRRRVAPLMSTLPGTPLGWLAVLYPLTYFFTHFSLRNSVVGLVIMYLALFFSIVFPRVYKHRFDSRGGEGSLLNIPDAFLMDLYLAGYPLSSIVAGIWGSGLHAFRLTWMRKLLTGVAMIVVTLMLVKVSRWAMIVAALIFVGYLAAQLALRGCPVERALYRMRGLLARDRPDLNKKWSGWDSIGVISMLMTIIVATPFGVLVIATVLNPTPVMWERLLIYGAYPAGAALIGYAWGSLIAASLRHDLEIHHTQMTEFIQRLLSQVAEAGARTE